MPGAMLRTAAANAFSTGLWFSAATLVWSLAVLFRAAHPELHPCAAPYNKSRSIPAKRLWKHSGYFLKKRLITTNRCNGFNGATHPLCVCRNRRYFRLFRYT